MLVVEDDPGVQDILTLIFEQVGYDIIMLEYPDKLLDGSAPVPDIYILDKQLSGIDGLDVCRYLKKQLKTALIPVIVVSASPHIAQLAKDAGADGFLEKPFKQKELLELVARIFVAKGA